MVVHIVMFKLKEENKVQNLEIIKGRLLKLVDLVPSLNSMEVGINFTQSPRAFDLSLYSTFDSREALNEYALHPQHLSVVELIKELSIESKVVDYEM